MTLITRPRRSIRSLSNPTFKTNPYLERALMTGITRISKESIFSDLNNPRVISTTTDSYTASFGFTRDEVESSLKEYGLEDRLQEVQDWYDGFTYGKAAYGLMLTNREVYLMFEEMIEGWLSGSVPAYNDFIQAMLLR